MATIGKIRKRSGLLIAIIGIALGLFVLSDFITKGKRQSSEPLAIVFGDKITYQEFTSRVEQQKEFYKMQYGQDMQFATADLFQINNQVYDQMVRDIILQKEYDDLGLQVSDAEFAEMFTGRFVHPMIRQYFTNPETGVFDPNQVAMYIEGLNDMSEDDQRRWKMIEKMILEERIASKFTTLVNKGYYLPQAFVERDNVEKNRKFVTMYTALQYNTISDSTVVVTDEDLKTYYDAHKHEFEYDEPIGFADFVIFDIKPSDIDMNLAKTEIDCTYSSFNSVSDDELISLIYSRSDIDYAWDSSYLRREVLPVKADTLFNAKPGSVVAPYLDNNVFYMHRLMDRKQMPDSLEAAHILIAYQGAMRADESIVRTKEEAKQLADSLFAAAQGTDSAAFSNLAIQFSSDPSAAQNAGFLGWFPEGMMISEFNAACLNNPIGSYQLVETDFGYHIIKVLGKTKPVEKVRIATIRRTVEPSKETSDSIYNMASVFATVSTDQAAFDKAIVDNGYTKRVAENVKTTDFTLAGITEGREIVRWLFNDATEKGVTSTVFDLVSESKYVVAIVKDKKQKGVAEFDDVKEMITPFAKKDKKAEMLMEKMNSAMGGSATVEAVAAKLNADVDTFDVTFSTYSLPGYGPEPEVVGIMTASKPGVLSRVIEGEMGLFVFMVKEVVEPQPADRNAVMMQKMAFFQSKTNYELFKALERKADIEDNRILYY